MTAPYLAEHHRRMLLEESGIDPEVAEARGYHTVEKKVELEQLGFRRTQRKVPALLAPVYSPTGEISTYQIRPDQPRINSEGNPVKYETPGGSRMRFDVHPFMRDKLDDPSVPLFVTEGVKKGDSLVSRGLCAVTLLGVWNFRGTNDKGGKTVLAEWEYVAFNGRRVYIVFDSDIMIKPGVYRAMVRIKTFLEFREAEVRIISLTTANGTWLVDCFEVDPRPIFPILGEKELVVHNALFDLGFLTEMGFELGEAGRMLDTMLTSQVLEDKENA